MHPNAVTAIVERLTFVAQNLIYPPGHPLEGEKILNIIGETTAFGLTDQANEAHQKVIHDLLWDVHHWDEKFSERHLRGKLLAIMLRVISERRVDPIAMEFGLLVAEFEDFAEQWTMLVPLAGIQIQMEELAIGNVLLANANSKTAVRVAKGWRSIFMNRAGSVREKLAVFKDFKKQNLVKIMNRVCAVVNVVAESTRAAEIAIEETRRAVDLLRISILFLDPGKDKKVVGLLGEACEDGRSSVGIDNTGNADFRGSMSFYPFLLTTQSVDEMREMGVFVLSGLLQKKEPTDFEEVILQAAHWLASAQTQYENENALLNLVTCLETFLKPASGDPITATIAEGVAILTASGLEERKRRKAQVKGFYALRSKLTHGGRGEIVSSDLNELTGIARDLTIQMIRRKDEFQTQRDLCNWIDDQKLLGSSPADVSAETVTE